ncbi:HEAT repeat domain-containing protein [Serinicoccus sp. LYQ131]|uniref:HEAT repeat domain-containing protein n=1 Tax=Serinicoccus sp. LYQ131 TaxID=3378797 RepID=UPI003852C7E6
MTTLDRARRAVSDPSPTVRQQAALHLGTHGDATLTPDLVSLLVDEGDFFVRETLTWAVVRHPEAALAPLLDALDRCPDARVQVLHALSKIQAPEAVPQILRFADARQPGVAAKAWWALGRTGTPEAAPALLAHLGEGEEEQRRELSRALEQLGAPAVEGLADALAAPDPAVRHHAAQALVLIGDPAARPAAAALAEAALAPAAQGEGRETALVALEALAPLDAPEVEEALMLLRDGEDRFLSLTAQWLLADRAERAGRTA